MSLMIINNSEKSVAMIDNIINSHGYNESESPDMIDELYEKDDVFKRFVVSCHFRYSSLLNNDGVKNLEKPFSRFLYNLIFKIVMNSRGEEREE